MDNLLGIVKSLNGVLWNALLLVLLCGTGLFFSIRLKFVQVRRFPQAFKATFGSIRFKGDKAGADGMSSFQSFATAVAAQVGTGNLAGAATALASGGPGAIFWMWVSAFFGMATIYAEAILGQKYKKTVNGEVTGGPAYYIQAAFKGKLGKILSASFSVLIILALGFMGNMVQSNSIGTAFQNAFNFSPLAVGIFLGILSLVIFFGGIKRIASVTEKIVPIMALLFIIGSIVAVGVNYQNIGSAFSSIFVGAFSSKSIIGGVIGVKVRDAMRYGVARGLFSNEAGMGSTPHAHAIAKVKHPCQQGLVAMMGVFVDTFIILNLTVLVILTSGVMNGDGTTGVELTQNAFTQALGGFGPIFIAICLFFFALSTIVGWYFFGRANVKFLFGTTKAINIYTVLVSLFVVLGSVLKVELVWELADLFNGLMVIPNLLGVLALSGVVVKLNNEFYRTPQDKLALQLDKNM